MIDEKREAERDDESWKQKWLDAEDPYEALGIWYEMYCIPHYGEIGLLEAILEHYDVGEDLLRQKREKVKGDLPPAPWEGIMVDETRKKGESNGNRN